VPPSPEPDRLIEEGETITIGSVDLKVVHTPGHAPGHVVLVGDGFVFGGDVLFQGSIGRTDLPGGSFDQLIQSIKTKMLTLPDETIVYCGHGPATTIGAERAGNPFLV
jgi:glyoxylase-like metal-dependent hydrolase (beta-lactamase superfamily II)